EQTSMGQLILRGVVASGHLTAGRWHDIAQTLALARLAPTAFALEGFVSEPKEAVNGAVAKWVVSVGIAGGLLLGLVLLWNAQMRRQVRERTRALQAEMADRLEAQKKLKQSERLLKIAGGVARVGGWIFNVADNRFVWSDEVCAIHDMPPGSAPLLDSALGFYSPVMRTR